jgi:hypothetical protein
MSDTARKIREKNRRTPNPPSPSYGGQLLNVETGKAGHRLTQIFTDELISRDQAAAAKGT